MIRWLTRVADQDPNRPFHELRRAACPDGVDGFLQFIVYIQLVATRLVGALLGETMSLVRWLSAVDAANQLIESVPSQTSKR